MATLKVGFVVGNDFAASCCRWILSEQQCTGALLGGRLPFEAEAVSFGQGISLKSAREIKRLFLGTGRFSPEQIGIPDYFNSKISAARVHKSNPDNVIIADFNRVSDSEFACSLFIDARPDILGDHISGRHLPGMLLLEAARQCSIAALEERKACGDRPGDPRIAVLSWQTFFTQFAYPLPLSLQLRIDTPTVEKECVEEVFTADFIQMGLHIGRAVSRYRLISSDRTLKIEDAMLSYLERLSKEVSCKCPL